MLDARILGLAATTPLHLTPKHFVRNYELLKKEAASFRVSSTRLFSVSLLSAPSARYLPSSTFRGRVAVRLL